MNKDWIGNTTSIFSTIGASNHSDHEREPNDFYATSPEATQWLMRLECFNGPILEPSCGTGHISEVLKEHGYDVTSRDIIDRGYGEGGCDFLSPDNTEWNGDIVTNPPYRFASQFVEKALQIIPEGHKVAMLLKLTFLEGQNRRALFTKYPPPYHIRQQRQVEVRHERRLRQHQVVGHRIRMVRVAQGLHRQPCNQMVQLTQTKQ